MDDDKVFAAIQQNRHPITGVKLTQRNKADAVRFYDFQCSAQKSVSVMAIVGGDERLQQAHREGVAFAMREMEEFAAIRVRKGDRAWSNDTRITGNLCWAEFQHDASRALDPQLHTHNVVCNATFDSESGQYFALETAEMCKAIRYAGKVYQNFMAAELQKLGYDIELKRGKKGEIEGFEIAGISEDVLKKFSKRRADIEREIEQFAEREGRNPTAQEVSYFSRITRDRKLAEISTPEVREFQKSALSEAELNCLSQLRDAALCREQSVRSPETPKVTDAVNATIEHLFERNSVLAEDKVIAEVLNQNLGRFTLEEIRQAVRDDKRLLFLAKDAVNPKLTTSDNLEREQWVTQTVNFSKEKALPLNTAFLPFMSQEKADEAQAQVIKRILECTDRYMLFRGVAGAGKTTTLKELCKVIKLGENENIKVIAPTNSAVAVLKDEGFADAETLASFLLKKQVAKGSVLIVDESGLNSVHQGASLMQVAEEHGCRVIFVGDARQHSGVEAGDFFSLLEKHTAISKVELSKIHRQKNELYKQGIEHIANGDIESGFELFNEQDWIQASKGKFFDGAAQDFMRFTDGGKNPEKCIAVAITHKECDKLSEKIRLRLKGNGVLGKKVLELNSFRSFGWTKAQKHEVTNYHAGVVICFTTNTDIASAGKSFRIREVQGEALILDNGTRLLLSAYAERIESGELRPIELCEGDLVQFSVNDKTRGIINGQRAKVLADASLLNLDSGKMLSLSSGFSGLDFGWVSTSHKSQGRTANNVIVAAEKMDAKAFYVALSRGRYNMRLHCPDISMLKDSLFKSNDRLSAMDVIDDKKDILSHIPDKQIKPDFRVFRQM